MLFYLLGVARAELEADCEREIAAQVQELRLLRADIVVTRLLAWLEQEMGI